MRRTTRLTLGEKLESKTLLDANGLPPMMDPETFEQPKAAGLDVAEGESEQVADFSLVDVNATSLTFEQAISPRDFIGKTTAWYFGHAT